MRPALISVIVATYNWPEALDRVLDGLAHQDDRGFEVIVADDGSGPETRALVADRQTRFPVPLRHAWQADEGFRLSRSRNNAAQHARGDFLIFMDGDCEPRPSFVSGHGRAARPGRFNRGWRVFLTEAFTREVLDRRLPLHAWSPLALFAKRRRIMAKPSHAFRLFGWPPARNDRRTERADNVEGCNLGIWREDFLRVGGFDESYGGYGNEDIDMAVRLIRSGCLRREVRHTVTLLHLHHRMAQGAADVDMRLAAVRARDGYEPVASLLRQG